MVSLLTQISFGQITEEQNDTVRYTGPSICECIKHSATNPQLLSRCEQKYDYNSMSVFQRTSFEEKIKACSDPEICDCQERGPYDKELQKTCDKKFDEASMTEDELEDYLKDKDDCYVRSIEKPSLKRICDCVNSDEYTEENEDEFNAICSGIWDISNLTNSERQEFVHEVSQCIENKDDPNFTLTLCECLNVSDNDLELKERCITKFDLNTMTAEDIAMHREKMGDCSVMESGDDLTLICNCLKEERELGQMSSNCIKKLASLESKYKNKSPEEMEDFVKQLMDCLMIKR